MVMAAVAITYRKKTEVKDWFFRVMSLIVVGLYGYLLVYFFIFSGCEDLIKYWVVGNLAIILAFVAFQLMYAVTFKGTEGLQRAISK